MIHSLSLPLLPVEFKNRYKYSVAEYDDGGITANKIFDSVFSAEEILMNTDLLKATVFNTSVFLERVFQLWSLNREPRSKCFSVLQRGDSGELFAYCLYNTVEGADLYRRRLGEELFDAEVIDVTPIVKSIFEMFESAYSSAG